MGGESALPTLHSRLGGKSPEVRATGGHPVLWGGSEELSMLLVIPKASSRTIASIGIHNWRYRHIHYLHCGGLSWNIFGSASLLQLITPKQGGITVLVYALPLRVLMTPLELVALLN